MICMVVMLLSNQYAVPVFRMVLTCYIISMQLLNLHSVKAAI